MSRIRENMDEAAGIRRVFLIAITLLPVLSIAQEMLPETQRIFGKYSDRVLKIQQEGSKEKEG